VSNVSEQITSVLPSNDARPALLALTHELWLGLAKAS
jgi:hypothetical protein